MAMAWALRGRRAAVAMLLGAGSRHARRAPQSDGEASARCLLGLYAGAAERRDDDTMGQGWGHPPHRLGCTVLAVKHQRVFFSLPSPATEKALDMHNLVPYSPEHMYQVVADVARYQEFLPYCCSSTILCRRGEHDFDAELGIGFNLFQEKYTSKVTLDPATRTVRSTLVASEVFSELHSTWQLKAGAEPDTCRIEFHVDFTVSSALHSTAINAFFEDISRQQMAAFATRAGEVPYVAVAPTSLPPPSPTPPSLTPPLGVASSTSQPLPSSSVLPAASLAAAAAVPPPPPPPRRLAAAAPLPLAPPRAPRAGVRAPPLSLRNVRDAFLKHADEGGHLDLQRFIRACTELSPTHAAFRDASRKPIVAAVVFNALDENGDGEVDVDEFVGGVYLLCRAAPAEKAQHVFALLDRNGDGIVTRAEVEALFARQLASLARLLPELLRVAHAESSLGGELTASEFVNATDGMLQEATREVNSFVEELFRQLSGSLTENMGKGTSLQQRHTVGIDESTWLAACHRIPELLDLMTADGMLRMVNLGAASGRWPSPR